MKIQEITSQHRRDFTAVMICEHCNETEALKNGYDDNFYHQNIIPNMECKSCGKKSPAEYRALSTKYADHEVV